VRALTAYLSYEMLAIHLLTGALFAFLNVVLFIGLWDAAPWFALAIVPFTAFCTWGWYAEYRVFADVSRQMRARG
jgi:hypothetical protein